MLKELRFVMGAVAKKDFLPAMTHFVIKDGFVRSYNGSLALSSSIPFDIDCIPKAQPLVKAISLCEETITLAMTPAGKLKIQSGKFRSYVECISEETAHVLPEGEFVEVDCEKLYECFKTLIDFVGDDASRPWTNGVLLKGASAYATNNVLAVEYWLGVELNEPINIPSSCIKEMLRIKEAPSRMQIAKDSVTFHYTDDRWVRTQLFDNNWPPLDKIINKEGNVQPLNKELFDGLQYLKPFVDATSRVYINGDVLTTCETNNEEGSSYTIDGFNVNGIYSLPMLMCLKNHVESIDWTMYPKPCLFYGKNLRGVIIGMKL